MTYVIVIVLVLAVGALVLAAVSRASSGSDAPEEVDRAPVTDTSEHPPAHPDRPVPGSDADRDRRGRP